MHSARNHMIARELILPTALDMVSIMINVKSTIKLKPVPLSNDTITRCLCNISQDMEDQLIEKVKGTRFTLQVDEATDGKNDCLLIAYIRYVTVCFLSF